MFVVILVLSTSSPTIAAHETPLFKTESELSQYLSYLNRVLPEAFVATGNYYIDPKGALAQEQEFLKWYYSTPVQKILNSEVVPQFEPKKIAATVQKQVLQKSIIPNDAAVSNLIKNFESMSQLFASEEKVLKELVRLDELIQGRTSFGILTGLVQCLDDSIKKEAFRSSREQKIEIVKKNLTKEMLNARYRQVGKVKENLDLASILREYAELLNYENEIAKVALFYLWDKDQQARSTIFNALDPEVKAGLLERVRKLLRREYSSSSATKLTESLSGLMAALFESQSTEKMVPVWQTQESFSIEEVPAGLGTFRGCINGDCFTKFAFGFTYAPSERTLLVRNAKGEAVFTIYASLIQFKGSPTLMIHDLGSAKANAAFGTYVMRALNDSKDKLGYKHLVVARESMHWYIFSQAIVADMETQEWLPTTFYDPLSRDAIGTKLMELLGPKIKASAGLDPSYAKSHDLPSAHAAAAIYKPKPWSADTRLLVQVQDLDPNQYDWTRIEVPRTRVKFCEKIFRF